MQGRHFYRYRRPSVGIRGPYVCIGVPSVGKLAPSVTIGGPSVGKRGPSMGIGVRFGYMRPLPR